MKKFYLKNINTRNMVMIRKFDIWSTNERKENLFFMIKNPSIFSIDSGIENIISERSFFISNSNSNLQYFLFQKCNGLSYYDTLLTSCQGIISILL
jgi:hypothetical protein